MDGYLISSEFFVNGLREQYPEPLAGVNAMARAWLKTECL
jgi:hypothetical protein